MDRLTLAIFIWVKRMEKELTHLNFKPIKENGKIIVNMGKESTKTILIIKDTKDNMPVISLTAKDILRDGIINTEAILRMVLKMDRDSR
jgi:hypothetical protein